MKIKRCVDIYKIINGEESAIRKNYSPIVCSNCKGKLSDWYCSIITKLKRENLLTDDFEPICCFCLIDLQSDKNEN